MRLARQSGKSEVARGKLTDFSMGFCCGIFVGVASNGQEGHFTVQLGPSPENISQPSPARSRIPRMVGIRFTSPSPASSLRLPERTGAISAAALKLLKFVSTKCQFSIVLEVADSTHPARS
jgi:hypothetical protein